VKPPKKPELAPDSEIVIVGVRRPPVFRDLYFWFLRSSWSACLGMVTLIFLMMNALFALAYVEAGGIANARPGSFADAFFFSVQTMGTIGYGAMVPATPFANALMVVEAVVGMLFTAVATGLVFAKFSRFTGRVVFTQNATISDFNGVPTFSFRIGNDRDNQIVEVTIRAQYIWTQRTLEGNTWYRTTDLPLVRERAPVLSRSWVAMHSITETSPLYGLTPEDLKKLEAEFWVSISGTDDTSLQLVHARHRYKHEEVLWAHRHADVLTERPDGVLVMDVAKFNDVVPATLLGKPPGDATK